MYYNKYTFRLSAVASSRLSARLSVADAVPQICFTLLCTWCVMYLFFFLMFVPLVKLCQLCTTHFAFYLFSAAVYIIRSKC